MHLPQRSHSDNRENFPQTIESGLHRPAECTVADGSVVLVRTFRLACPRTNHGFAPFPPLGGDRGSSKVVGTGAFRTSTRVRRRRRDLSNLEAFHGLNPRTLFSSIEDGRALAQAIVDTLREPLLVLDKDLRVLSPQAARSIGPSRSTARMSRAARSTRSAMANGTFRSCGLLLERILPQHTIMDAYEVEHEFPEHRPADHAAERAQGVLRGAAPYD